MEDCGLNFEHPPKKDGIGLGERQYAELRNYAYYTICTLFFLFLFAEYTIFTSVFFYLLKKPYVYRMKTTSFL